MGYALQSVGHGDIGRSEIAHPLQSEVVGRIKFEGGAQFILRVRRLGRRNQAIAFLKMSVDQLLAGELARGSVLGVLGCEVGRLAEEVEGTLRVFFLKLYALAEIAGSLLRAVLGESQSRKQQDCEQQAHEQMILADLTIYPLLQAKGT